MSSTPHESSVTLPTRFDATSVRAVYEEVRNALTLDHPVRVDGTGVEVVDAAGAQLLAALALTGRPVRVKASTELERFLTETALSAVVPLEH